MVKVPFGVTKVTGSLTSTICGLIRIWKSPATSSDGSSVKVFMMAL